MPKRCSDCGGTGRRNGGRDCNTCDGRGEVDVWIRCDTCGGGGQITATTDGRKTRCPRCSGEGGWWN